jgi:hypothetical protein
LKLIHFVFDVTHLLVSRFWIRRLRGRQPLSI